MAKIIEWNEEQKKEWLEWVKSRPPIIQDMCEKLPPCNLYLLKPTGQKVTLHSYSEDGTLTVNVTGEYNMVMYDRRVFGIKPEDLEECDLPNDDEITGAVLTDECDIDSFTNFIRPTIIGNKPQLHKE